jgi:hypothetical protein
VKKQPGLFCLAHSYEVNKAEIAMPQFFATLSIIFSNSEGFSHKVDAREDGNSGDGLKYMA